MQRIVMSIQCSDDCTYFFTETYPIHHLSTVDALFEFEQMNNSCTGEFEFCGRKFWKRGENEELPDFYTIDEWFEKECLV